MKDYAMLQMLTKYKDILPLKDAYPVKTKVSKEQIEAAFKQYKSENIDKNMKNMFSFHKTMKKMHRDLKDRGYRFKA